MKYYRPSNDSIMNRTPDNPVNLNKFNVISCGYIVSAIKREPLDKGHAQTHWALNDPTEPGGKGCKAMDTVDGGIPDSPAPTITGPVSGGGAYLGSDLFTASALDAFQNWFGDLFSR